MKRMLGIPSIVLLSTLFVLSCTPRIGGDGNLKILGRNDIDMVYGFDIDNGYAYLTTNSGLAILDVSNVNKPKQVGNLKIGSPLFDVEVMNGIAYIGGGGNGFLIADVSDHANPKLLSRYQDHGEIYDVKISGNYVYLADRTEGLKILEIMDDYELKLTGQFNNGGPCTGLAIRDKVVYLADGRDGVEIIDVSTPESPELVSTVADIIGVWSVNIFENRLFVGSHTGVRIMDISIPDNPRGIFNLFDGEEVLGVRVYNDLLFASKGGVTLLDIKNLEQSVKLAEWTISGGVHDIHYDGKYIYTAKSGFYILKLEQ